MERSIRGATLAPETKLLHLWWWWWFDNENDEDDDGDDVDGGEDDDVIQDINQFFLIKKALLHFQRKIWPDSVSQ